MAIHDELPDRFELVAPLSADDSHRARRVVDRFAPGCRLIFLELKDANAAAAARRASELEELAELRHPGLAELRGVTHQPGGRWVRLIVDDPPGTDIVSAQGRGAAALLRPASQALRVLDFLHGFGRAHGALSPSALWLRDRPRVGFRVNLAGFSAALRPNRETVSLANPALAYLAPERLDGSPATPAGDIYAIGAVLHEAIHGRPPVQLASRDLEGFVAAVQAGRRARPALPDGYPATLAPWLESLLEPDPANRPPDAATALDGLRGVRDTGFDDDDAADRAARLVSATTPGRTALGDELANRLGGEELRVVWLVGDRGSGRARVVDRIAAGWRVRGGAVLDPPPDAAQLQDLQRGAAERPALLVLRDPTAGGSATLRMLRRVVEESDGAPVRVVAMLEAAMLQEEPWAGLVAGANRLAALERFDLAPLDPDLVAHVSRRSAESGAQGTDASMLLGDRLGDDGLALLEALGLASEGLPSRLAELAALDTDRAEAAMGDLVSIGLARRRDDHWAVASPGLGDRIVGGLTPTRREPLTRKATTLLEDDLRLGRLWLPLDPRRAADHALRAVAETDAADDPERATAALRLALRALGRRDAARGRLWLDLAKAARRAGRPRIRARALAAAARGRTDRTARVELMLEQAEVLIEAERHGPACLVARRALGLAAGSGSELLQGRARLELGLALAGLGERSAAHGELEAAFASLEPTPEARHSARALLALGRCEAAEGRAGAAERLEQAIARLGRERPDRAIVDGMIERAALESRAGRPLQARGWLEQARVAVVDADHAPQEVDVDCALARAELDLGRIVAAIEGATRAERRAARLGASGPELAAATIRGRALAVCGRAADGERTIAEALERLERHGAIAERARADASLGRVEALLAARRVDLERAGKLLEELLRLARSQADIELLPRALGLALELELRRAEGPAKAARSLRDELAGLAGRGPGWSRPLVESRLELARARRALEAGEEEEQDEPISHARRAVERAAALELPLVGAEAHALLGEALERADDTEGAEEADRAGRELLEAADRAIGDAELARSFTSRPPLGRLRRPAGLAEAAIDRRLVALYEMIRTLNSASDPDDLLESILDMAIEAVRADRGMILLRDGAGELEVRLSRRLRHDNAADAEAFSRRIVAESSGGKSVLALDAGADPRFNELRSISLHGIRSLMCVPLRSRGAIIGSVYLDSRRAGARFTADTLRFLEAFADHAALALDNARARQALHAENERLQAVAEARAQFGNLIGESAGMRQVFELIERVSTSELPVLIQGESGTGKELVARAVHFNGRRRRETFISENCASIPDSLLQSELFGHARGAFTGAVRDRRGLFELADGGTLFLDEVGDMAANMQAQLLRVLQEGEIRRVGADRPIPVDVRVLAATHRDLAAEVAAGRFREDLMYRLQVLVIHIPPLRERPGDVRLLTDYLLERIGDARGRPVAGIDPEVLELIERYPWPGNVRQLESTIQRLVLLAGSSRIDLSVLELDSELHRTLAGRDEPDPVPLSLERSEREQVRLALEAASGNRTHAARLLGISRATIYRKLKEYGL